MENKYPKIFDKLKQTLPKPEDLTKEFTYYNPAGGQIYDTLMNLNVLEVELHDIITKNVFKDIDYYSIVGQR